MEELLAMGMKKAQDVWLCHFVLSLSLLIGLSKYDF